MPLPAQRIVDLVTGDTWPKRRRVVYFALGFCGLVIAFCLGAATAAKDMSVVRAMGDHAFWLGAAIVGSYVFGSIWDDNNKRRHLDAANAQGDE